MSQQSRSTFTSSSFSYSSSSSNINGQQSGQRSTQQTYTDPSGNTTVRSSSQNLGGPLLQETRRFDAQGQEMTEGPNGDAGRRRIEDVSDEQQAERDREYEEKMEDEYAKREGGA